MERPTNKPILPLHFKEMHLLSLPVVVFSKKKEKMHWGHRFNVLKTNLKIKNSNQIEHNYSFKMQGEVEKMIILLIQDITQGTHSSENLKR